MALLSESNDSARLSSANPDRGRRSRAFVKGVPDGLGVI